MTSRGYSLFAISVVILGLGLHKSVDEPEDLSRSTIYSVLHRGDIYIASTQNGIYETSPGQNVWQKIPTPSAMHARGRLVQRSDSSPELAYFKGIPSMYNFRNEEGALFLSHDAGKTWQALPLHQQIMDAFIHPDGSIYAVTETMVTTPFPPGGNSVSTTGKDGVTYYPSEHLLVSRDPGVTWKDITPPLRAAFGLYGIFQDPDHPDLVCVGSAMIYHVSRTLFYQAEDANYHWKEISWEEAETKLHRPQNFFWRIASGGHNNGDAPATLENFFKFPYPRSGHDPELPTMYLVTDKPAYQFHLNQPMPVVVTTFFMFPQEHDIKWLDNKSEKIFWGLSIEPEGEKGFTVNPQTVELNIDIPDKAAKKAAYLNDPSLTTVRVDSTHPYQRTVDLRKLYDFTKPGNYRLQILHNDQFLDREDGSVLGTDVINVTVVP